MEEKKSKTIQEELNENFTNEYIYNVGLLVHSLAEKFYEENELEGRVYFNDDIFANCLIDILVDIVRLKHFHDIDLVNYIKLISYTASWIINHFNYLKMQERNIYTLMKSLLYRYCFRQ